MQLNIPTFRVAFRNRNSLVGPPFDQLPNALTVARLLVSPVFAAVLFRAQDGHSWLAGLILASVAGTDQIDGWLARRWRAESEFGKRFDVLADRAVLGVAIIGLLRVGRLPWGGVAILGGREVSLAVTRLLMPPGFEYRVSSAGKLSAWVLYAALGLLIVTPPKDGWAVGIFWCGVALALAAAVGYFRLAWLALRGQREPTGARAAG